MEIQFKKIKERQVACIIATGSEHIPQIFGELREYITKNNIITTGHPYCTFFNNTLNVTPEELHYEIGISITGDVDGEGMIKIKKIHEHYVVSTAHNGREVDSIYNILMEYAVQNGYLISGPVTEIYLNDPVDFPQSNPHVEVRFPLIKK